MTIEIKILRSGEERILANVAPDVFDDPINEQAAKSFLADPRHHVAVAIDDGIVVGFVSAVHYVHPDKHAPELWINEVGVASTHQRRGIAKSLLQLLLDRARELGCSEAWVLTERGNTNAIGLYQSAGGQASADEVVMFNFPLA